MKPLPKVGAIMWQSVILCFIVRNIYLVFIPSSGTELIERLTFPKW